MKKKPTLIHRKDKKTPQTLLKRVLATGTFRIGEHVLTERSHSDINPRRALVHRTAISLFEYEGDVCAMVHTTLNPHQLAYRTYIDQNQIGKHLMFLIDDLTQEKPLSKFFVQCRLYNAGFRLAVFGEHYALRVSKKLASRT